MLEKLLSFRDVFEPQLSAVGEIQSLSISDGLRSPQQRTVALNNVFVKLKEQDAFPCLRGWRSEVSDSARWVVEYMNLAIVACSTGVWGDISSSIC